MSEFVKVLLGDQGTFEDVYQECPVFDDGKYCLRLVAESDAEDLLKVYSDGKAVPFFNSDNCGGDDFHYTSLERMREAVSYWLWEYERRGFVDGVFSTIKEILQQIGTPAFEMFSCRMLATKAVPTAKERIQALAVLGFEESDQALTGHDGTQYKYYWVLNKK